MNQERLYTAVSKMQEICDSINIENRSNVEYVVLQGIKSDDKYAKDPFIVHKITNFYNYNWTGNIDFMHIPDFNQVYVNCNSYPIIIARDKKTKEILGISTIKYDENNKNDLDPYYPIENQKYFSITGILTKKNNKEKGIGKKIYEIAMRGHHEFKKVYKDTRLICVIDCRNKNSINAIYSATKNINDNQPIDVQSRITSYYLVTDEYNNMLEAPTIVVEIKDNKSDTYKERPIIEFESKDRKQFISLLKTLREALVDRNNKPIINEDSAGIVSYYEVKNSILPKIYSNGTEKGNDRIPRVDEEVYVPYKLQLVKKKHG